MRLTLARTMVSAILVFGGSGLNSFAQDVPWDAYLDAETNITCDVVNAGNLEVVVLTDTGRLVVVTDADSALSDAAFVNEQGVYFYGGIPVGEISFANDGSGFRTLWLLAPDDTVLDLDRDTGEPIFTNHVPDDFLNVPCDAFELWDDDDFDEVPDGDDACPLDFGDYRAGCPCEVFDDDDDTVNNCFDDCPDTPLGADVDEDGCEIVIVVDSPPVTVIQPPITFACGNFLAPSLAMTFGALIGLRLVRKRYL